MRFSVRLLGEPDVEAYLVFDDHDSMLRDQYEVAKVVMHNVEGKEKREPEIVGLGIVSKDDMKRLARAT